MSTLTTFSKMQKPYIGRVSKPNYKLSYKQRKHNLEHGIWVDEIGNQTKLCDIHSNYLFSLITGAAEKTKNMPPNVNKNTSFNLQWLSKLRAELNSRTDTLSESNRVRLFLLGI